MLKRSAVSALNFYHQVYALVERIPCGQVMTYGQIAALLGVPHAARAVGYALRRTPPEIQIPWWRVINAQGKISPRSAAIIDYGSIEQRRLLEQEGLVFRADDSVDLARCRWLEGLIPSAVE